MYSDCTVYSILFVVQSKYSTLHTYIYYTRRTEAGPTAAPIMTAAAGAPAAEEGPIAGAGQVQLPWEAPGGRREEGADGEKAGAESTSRDVNVSFFL